MTKPAAVGGVNIPRRSNVLTASWYSDDTINKYEKGKLPTNKHLGVMATKNLLRTGTSLGSLANLFLWVKKIVTGSGSSNSLFSSNKFLIPSTLLFGALPFLESLLRSDSDVADSSHQAKEAGSIHNTGAVPENNTPTPEMILASGTILNNLLKNEELYEYLTELGVKYETPQSVIKQGLLGIKLIIEGDNQYVQTVSDKEYSYSQPVNVNGKNKLAVLRITLSDLIQAYEGDINSIKIQILTKDLDSKESIFSSYGEAFQIDIPDLKTNQASFKHLNTIVPNNLELLQEASEFEGTANRGKIDNLLYMAKEEAMKQFSNEIYDGLSYAQWLEALAEEPRSAA